MSQVPPPLPGQGSPATPYGVPTGSTGGEPYGQQSGPYGSPHASPPPLPTQDQMSDQQRMPSPGRLPDPGPLPDPGAMPDPAALQVTEQTRTYPCPACGGTLAFDPDSSGLKCLSCGNQQPVTGISGVVGRHDLGTAMRELTARQQEREQHQQHLVSHDTVKEIVCQSCGGHTAFSGSMTAIRCPYCNTPIQRDDLQDAPVRMPVDGVLPLAIGEKPARAEIEKWINSRWFAPNEFKKYRTLGSFTSIYLTYFSYDADTTTHYTGMRGDTYTVTVGSGDNQRTETRTRWTPAFGTVTNQVRNLPALANQGLDTPKVSALEPWPIEQAQPYNPQFVSGHLSRTYDLDAAQTFEALGRPAIDAEIDTTIRWDIGGDQQQISSKDTSYQLLNFAQLLMPVWLLTVTYQSKPYQVFINGVTGEVQGQRPYSAIKITLAVMAAVIVLIVIFVLYNMFGGGN